MDKFEIVADYAEDYKYYGLYYGDLNIGEYHTYDEAAIAAKEYAIAHNILEEYVTYN